MDIENNKKCPKCLEQVKKDASVCKHCGKNIGNQLTLKQFIYTLLIISIIVFFLEISK